MGRERSVDHGLGGKDTENSKQKRQKRADFQRKQALSRVKKVKNKTEIVFDDTAREDYLTGFRKRKTERRKFGLAMQIVKDQKAKKEALKERRATVAAATLGKSEENSDDDDDDDDEDKDSDEEDEEDENTKEDKDKEAVYDDECTTSMFGGSVSVVVAQDMSDMLDSHNHPDLYTDEEAFRKRKNLADKAKSQPMTKLERAYKKVANKGMLGKTKKASNNGTFDRNGNRISSKERKLRKKEGKKKGGSKPTGLNGKQLLSKAMGSGMLGTNSFKGSAKKSRGKK